MEQSDRYWCPACERIHIDECEFYPLTLTEAQGKVPSVTPAQNTSATRSLALGCGAAGVTPSAPCVSRAGDLNALPIILLVPYVLMSFNMLKEVICG